MEKTPNFEEYFNQVVNELMDLTTFSKKEAIHFAEKNKTVIVSGFRCGFTADYPAEVIVDLNS